MTAKVTNIMTVKFTIIMTVIVQWTPLNGITDNGINRLMRSNLAHLTSPE
jgi:hypothetical protein